MSALLEPFGREDYVPAANFQGPGSLRLLDVDPSLGEGLDERTRAAARVAVRCARIDLPGESEFLSRVVGDEAAHGRPAGLIVVDGLLLCESALGRARAAQVLGPRDIT